MNSNLYQSIIRKLSKEGFVSVSQGIGYNPKSYYGDEQWVMYLDADNLSNDMDMIKKEVSGLFPELDILDVIKMKITNRHDEVWVFFKVENAESDK